MGANARITLWIAIAAGLGLAAWCADLRTPVEINSDGGVLRLTVAGSTLSARVPVRELSAIEISAMDGTHPPGGRFIEVEKAGRVLLRRPLPSRFTLPPGELAPVGDWVLDELAGEGVAWRHPVRVEGPFTVRAVLTGRFLHTLTITLRGEPTVQIRLRRGSINNDMFICDERGTPLAVTTIDPRAVESLLGVAATLLRGASAGACLIALFLGLGRATCGSARLHRFQLAVSRRSLWIPVLLMAAASVVASAWAARCVLDGLPHTPDSVTYLLQARWLAAGQAFLPAPPFHDRLNVPFTYVADGRWLPHYPIGWPILLAIGVAAGAPWLVASLLSGLFIVLLFLLGSELYDRQTALAACLLGLLSPMARLVFASLMAHAASATLILLFLWLYAVGRRQGGLWWGFGAGLSLGLAIAVRPLTALAVTVPGMWLGRGASLRSSSRSRRHAVAVAAGCAAGLLPLLVHNTLVTGSPLDLPYTLAESSMYTSDHVVFGLRNADALLAQTVPALFGWGWNLWSGWLFLALPVGFAWVPFLFRRHRREDLVLVGIIAAVAVAHLATRAHGLHGFGPRYYFEIFFCLYLLTARGFQVLARLKPGGAEAGADPPPCSSARLGAAATLLALSLATAIMLIPRLELYRGYNGVGGELRRQLGAQGITHGLVLLASHRWQDWAEASPMMSANPWPDLAFADAGEDPSELLDAFPDRPVYVWDGEQLRKLSAVGGQRSASPTLPRALW